MTLNIVEEQQHKPGPRIRQDKVELYEFLVATVAEYDIPVTTRHLFYRVTSAGLLAKTDGNYQIVGKEILKLRRSGDIAWSDITDGTRIKTRWVGYSSLREAAEEFRASYQRNIWAQNPVVPEVWSESRGLLGTINTVAGEYGVTTFGMGGYNSATLGWETAQDVVKRRDNGQRTVIFHVGDYDPSGRDIVRAARDEVADQLRSYGWTEDEVDEWFDFDSIALTDEQVKQYALPSAPAKTTDNRTARFIAQANATGQGTETVELDALDPRVLQDLIRGAIDSVLDEAVYNRAMDAAEAEKETLDAFIEGLKASGIEAFGRPGESNHGAMLFIPGRSL